LGGTRRRIDAEEGRTRQTRFLDHEELDAGARKVLANGGQGGAERAEVVLRSRFGIKLDVSAIEPGAGAVLCGKAEWCTAILNPKLVPDPGA
jgi:hypothetical protein